MPARSDGKMFKPRSDANPMGLAIMELISDGEWHMYEDVIQKLSPRVPAGQAFRVAERNRIRHYEDQGREPQDRKFGNKNSTILSGQRNVIQRSIANLRKNGRIEVEYKEPINPQYKRPLRIRLTEESFYG